MALAIDICNNLYFRAFISAKLAQCLDCDSDFYLCERGLLPNQPFVWPMKKVELLEGQDHFLIGGKTKFGSQAS